MIVADISALIALFVLDEPDHPAVRDAIEGEPGPIIVSPYVVAEVDHLIAARLGVEAELEALSALADGSYHLASIDEHDLAAIAQTVGRYRDQDIRAADASIVVLAHRYGTRRVLTLDRRFDVLRPLAGGRFRILP